MQAVVDVAQVVTVPMPTVGLAIPLSNSVSVPHSHIRKIEGFENQMREMEQLDIPVKEHFSKGVYAREITIPKGAIVSGEIHKYANLNILSKGELSIATENGVIRVKAPFTVVSPPGTKRLAYAHEETVWTTIHGTDETDTKVIEDTFIAHSFDEYLSFCAALQIEEK